MMKGRVVNGHVSQALSLVLTKEIEGSGDGDRTVKTGPLQFQPVVHRPAAGASPPESLLEAHAASPAPTLR